MFNASGTLVWRGVVDGYDIAVEVESTPLKMRFPGQYAILGNGLYYNYHRDYDPSIGRYLQSDPIGLRGGINTYLYAYANPLIFIDPFGLASLEFNGSNLTARDDGGNITNTWPATSGLPGTTAADQSKGNKGPIPEGNWAVDSSKSNYDKWYKIDWGNPDSWGDVRTLIEPQGGTNTYGRDQMYIHGGKTPGSLGCIDLTNNNNDFHDWLNNQSSIVPLTVRY
jgi:RHS repeat-associated protein